jgi:hypothetical protein
MLRLIASTNSAGEYAKVYMALQLNDFRIQMHRVPAGQCGA